MQNENEATEPNELNKKIARATKWSSVTELATKLIAPLVAMVLARLLAPEAFGVVATITMVISFAEIFTDAGFQKYLIQHEYKDKKELDQSTNVAFWTNFGVSLLVCFGIFVFRHAIARAVGSPDLGNSLSVASLLIVVAAFSSIQMARYRRAFDFKTLFYARIIGALIPVFVTIPLAFWLRNYWALLIGTMVGQTFTAVFLTIKSEWKPSFYYSFKQLKEMFAFSMWTLLETISIWLTGYVDIFIVGTYLNDYYLGLYRTSMTTVGAYMAVITGATTPVLFAALSRCQNNEQEFKNTYNLFQRTTAVLVVPMGIGVYLFSDFVTRVLLGDRWLEASGFIGLWGLTSAFLILFSHFSSEVFRSKGNPKISLGVQLLHLMFIAPTMLATIEFGFETLYTARALIRLQLLASAVFFVCWLYKFRLADMLKNVAPATVSALVMGAVGWGCLTISEHMLWQCVAIAICVVVYFATLFTCFPKIRREVFETRYGKKIVARLDAVGGRFLRRLRRSA